VNCLDARFLIDYTNEARERHDDAVAFYESDGGPIALTSTLALYEVYRGVCYYRSPAELPEVRRRLSWVHPVAFTDHVAGVAAEIRAELERRGEMVNGADVLIAATAMAHDVPVVTVDDDFERVDGLDVRSN
jgi:predicted nucleic acid-binding protein